MEKITFCINTAINERAHLELLLQSLLNGVDTKLHDFLVFVDADNQNTTEMLIEQKELFPNLTIIKNNNPEPIHYGKNINYMFLKAKTKIVSYLQSDMVVGLNYDKVLLNHLTSNMILSSTRIEPPLHAQYDNFITYVRNFGLNPNELNYSDFILYSESIKNSQKLTNFFFAPFTCYKNLWNDIGGHDDNFRPREDSDIAFRFCLAKYDVVQCWDAIVYHFTCTSSRGINWWKNQKELQKFEQERVDRDKFMLNLFVKKYGVFKHPSSYAEIEDDVKRNPQILNHIVCKNEKIDDSNFSFL